MKKIPNKFRKNRYDYKLIRREGGIVIYKQLDKGVVCGYEVHKVRLKHSATRELKRSNGELHIVKWPEREVLASNEEFGKYGWSYSHLKNTLKKFNELVLKQEEDKKCLKI